MHCPQGTSHGKSVEASRAVNTTGRFPLSVSFLPRQPLSGEKQATRSKPDPASHRRRGQVLPMRPGTRATEHGLRAALRNLIAVHKSLRWCQWEQLHQEGNCSRVKKKGPKPLNTLAKTGFRTNLLRLRLGFGGRRRRLRRLGPGRQAHGDHLIKGRRILSPFEELGRVIAEPLANVRRKGVERLLGLS